MSAQLDGYVSPRFVAALFGVPVHRVYRAVRNGRVRKVEIPGGRGVVVDIRDLRRRNFSGPPRKGEGGRRFE